MAALLPSGNCAALGGEHCIRKEQPPLTLSLSKGRHLGSEVGFDMLSLSAMGT
jgi:hypothetical protein